MRIPFPERILYSHAFLFASGLSVVQFIEGTDPLFTGCCFCFIMVAVAAFNVAGGVPYVSGVFIASNAIITFILPLVVKAILGEPAHTNLRTPMRTVEVYLVGMVAMLVAAFVSRYLRAKPALLLRYVPLRSLGNAYHGAAALAIILLIYGLLGVNSSYQSGSVASFINQVNRFPALALLLGSIYVIRRSGGTRSITGPLLLLIVVMSALGLLGFSKEAFLTPTFCWLIAVALCGYRLNWLNIGVFGITLYVTVAYMVPYAQVGRDYERPDLSAAQLSAYIITHFDEVRDVYNSQLIEFDQYHYYNRRLSLLNRLDILSNDDALIMITDREGTFGYEPVFVALTNFAPHFLYPNKPNFFFGNVYAHEIGILADQDNTTGVSFSASAEGYHEGGINGILILEPVVLSIVFLVLDSVFGDVRRQPVGLLMTIVVCRASVEGTLAGLITLLAQPLFAVVFAAFFCAYILPVLGTVFNRPILSEEMPELALEAAAPITTI